MSDDEKNLAKAAMTAQSLQLKIWLGIILGGIVGVLLAAYLVMPYFGEDRVLLGSVAGIATVFVCAWVGQRVILGMVAR